MDYFILFSFNIREDRLATSRFRSVRDRKFSLTPCYGSYSVFGWATTKQRGLSGALEENNLAAVADFSSHIKLNLKSRPDWSPLLRFQFKFPNNLFISESLPPPAFKVRILT